MASCKDLYINVDVPDRGLEEPRSHEQRSQSGSKGNSEEDGLYEAVDPLTKLERKPTELVPTLQPSAWRSTCSHRVVIGTCVALLTLSVSLNVLLLAVGTVHYSKMTTTLEQVEKENRQLQDAGPVSFLLYNAQHKLCVARQETHHLTGASCHPDDRAQHFQLLSGGLLRHVASQLCVAAPGVKNKQALLLKRCNAGSPLQRWECRDHDLLALEGEALYFNYGNSVKQLVILYSGSGPWSRWLVYGSHNNVCNPVCTSLGRDWTFFQGKHYFFSYAPGSWELANQSCAAMDSHLVMINSAEEEGHVTRIVKSSTSWIGLTDQVHEGNWKWVDGTGVDSKTSYWQTSEPNGGKSENCALMKNSLWQDSSCKESHRWICERML
uniref:Macrophage mannose receptor 1-like n=1 Tax=Pogona vitticeps TaxID=103695 RepID=A0ABM5FQS2_9SAUR